jgi:hypothetical protein
MRTKSKKNYKTSRTLLRMQTSKISSKKTLLISQREFFITWISKEFILWISGVTTFKWGGSTEPLDLKKIHIYSYIIYILNPLIFLYCTTDPTKLKPIFTYSFSNFILSLLWLAMNRSNSNKVRDRFDN